MDLPENELIDTHSHIYLSEFDHDREQVLSRAQGVGISHILLPGIDSSTHEAMLHLEKNSAGLCRAMMGVHPCSVKDNVEEELRIARNYLEKGSFIGIGEIGLDFYWDLSFVRQQYVALERQLAWAREFDLPFSLHSRQAIDQCIDVVSKFQDGRLRGVFHCFSGNASQAKKITDLGFYLGIGGVVTFKNGGLDKVLPDINLENIVVETDAPYLAPVPFRGKRNEPAYLEFVLDKIALAYQLDKKNIRKKISENTRKIFKI